MSVHAEAQSPFWEGCSRNELLLQQCSACGTFRHPPSAVCPNCLSTQHAWVRASGRATLYTFAVVRQALAKAWEDKVPYTVAVVELEEGPRFLTELVDVAPDDVAIGMPVEVKFIERDGVTLPLFRPR
jgi:uncharacterized OB-fold protein